MVHRLQCCKYMSFAGAGSFGASYVGVVQALNKLMPTDSDFPFQTFLSSLHGISGTSIGAFVGLGLLVQVPLLGIETIALKLLESIQNPDTDFSSLLTLYGVEKGTALKQIIGDMLRKAGLMEDITFEELHRLTKKEFVCVATDLSQQIPVYFSKASTPKTKLSDAIYMSMCIPFLFVPMRHNDNLCVDGCLTNNMPDAFPREETLYIDIVVGRQELQIDNLKDYFFSIVSFSIDNMNWAQNEKNCILIPFTDTDQNSITTLAITNNVYRSRLRIGFCCACEFLVPKLVPTIVSIVRFLVEERLEGQKLLLEFPCDTEMCSTCESAAGDDQCI